MGTDPYTLSSSPPHVPVFPTMCASWSSTFASSREAPRQGNVTYGSTIGTFVHTSSSEDGSELIHEAFEQGTNRLEDIVGGRGIPIEISCLISHLEYLENGIQAL